jgi:lon-related putative ATP-dependent protease
MPVEKLPTSSLRWHCDPATLGFETTADIDPFEGIGGQDEALETLRFGLEFNAPGQHVFVRGIRGTGRLTMVQSLLDVVERPVDSAPDHCYVYNFGEPERPRLITLPRGRAEAFGQAIDDLCEFIAKPLGPALRSDKLRKTGTTIDELAETEMRGLTEPLEKDLADAGLALMMAKVGGSTRPVIVPLIDGSAVAPEQVDALLASGDLTPEAVEERLAKAKDFAPRVQALSDKAIEIQKRRGESLKKLIQGDARQLLDQELAPIRTRFPQPGVRAFLDELTDDVINRRLTSLDEAAAFTRLYRVNVLLAHQDGEPNCRIIEDAPSVSTLLGSIEFRGGPEGAPEDVHTWIHPGSILRADGGFLVIDARDLLTEPGAWQVLVRTLRSGRLDFTVPDRRGGYRGPVLKPEPIPVNLKVILIGEPGVYRVLDSSDADFSQLFKVLVDFDNVIPRDIESIGLYARVLARMSKTEDLPPFDAEAVAALAEHGARIAARREKLTARLARVADIAREAAFLAAQRDATTVAHEDVVETVRRTKRRANLPARRFRESIADGSIRINTDSTAIGQINGLAVIQTGPLTYGFPTRISATAGPGSGGTINIEGEARLSGAIHTKSFYILGGLLRNLLLLDHPLVFDASIAFEQSYGGIDGDSASGAALCCLLSALTGFPIDQGLAMTGAIDQVGNVLPIGAVNEKIEGFFDTCNNSALTGKQGVIIPRANVGDLMLRRDVVTACDEGRFSVYAVDRIEQALELFFGASPGERGADNAYPDGSLLAAAVDRARVFWRASAPPGAN